MQFIRIVACITAGIIFFSVEAHANESDNQAIYAKAQGLMDSYNGKTYMLREARRLLQKIVANNPESKYAYVGYGRLAYKSGYISSNKYVKKSLLRSIAYFKKAIQVAPRFVDAYYYATYSYIFSRQYDNAKKMVLQAKALAPDSGKIDILFGEIAEAEKDFTASIKYAKSAINKNPLKKTRIDAYRLLKKGYVKQKKYDLAEKAYLMLIELEPDSAWAKGNYSYFLTKYLQEYDRAIEQGKQALQIMNYGMGRYVTGRAYYKKAKQLLWKNKNYDEAIKNYLQAITYDSRNANSYYGLAVAHYRMGNIKKDESRIVQAKEYLLKAIEIKPDHKQARQLLEDVNYVLDFLKKNKKNSGV